MMGDSVSPGEHLELHSNLPITDHSKFDRSCAGHVDDGAFTSVLSVRTAIDDYHVDSSSVLEIRHPRNGAEGKPTVCGNCLSIVEFAATRRQFAVKAVCVIGRVSELCVQNLDLFFSRNASVASTEHK